MNTSVILAFAASLIATFAVHPYLVRIALAKNIVDNPNARKLQKRPIPVLGGAAIFLGIIIGTGVSGLHIDCSSLMIIISAMVVMLYIGMIDDILGLSPMLRFVLEILLVCLLIGYSGLSIDNFHGLLHINSIPMWVAFPLTVIATVGIINSINLIDGVDGLSSGYCMLACSVFGYYFGLSGQHDMLILASASVGSMLPFFLHNVFGQSSKMFIGDGGTLTMGIVLSTFVVHTLSDASNAPVSLDPSFGLIPFSLAVMSIPVFDTLRVMLARIMRGTSPFHPDKTHLHHLFIEMRFSHAGAAVSIIFLNAMVIAAQLLTWKLGGSINMQMLVVVVVSLLCTIGLYYTMHHISEKNILKRAMYRIGLATRFERKGVFSMLQHLVDKL